MNRNIIKDIVGKIAEIILFICALIAVLSTIGISIFLLYKGLPPMFKIGVLNFIFGMKWAPGEDLYGILPLIVTSIYATLGAIILGVPIGVLTAIFLAEIAPKKLVSIVKPAIELLAGIPSVVYGFFGLIVFVPILNNIFGNGNSLLSGIIILGIMILPTIINISESSLRSVHESYKEGSMALGASHIQTIFNVMIPAAKSGILASIVLGIGRAIGEAMAFIMVSGNNIRIPSSLIEPVRSLPAHIAIDMGEASGLHQEALFAAGVTLFIFIMILNFFLNFFLYKAGEN